VRVFERGRGDVYLTGPHTKALLKDASGFQRAVMLKFKPGWSTPLLGLPAHELTDRYVRLEDIWGSGGAEVVHALVAAQSSQEVVRCLARAFARKPRPSWEPASASLVRRAATLLEEEGVRVESIAEQLGITPRHLRRAFGENIGIAPKMFARAVRLQRALRLSQSLGDWGRIAVDAGFYDQAHLIADFRALVGLTPNAFAERANQPSAAA
jgi:transcriptional regulator GlxA family with amidase domain